MIHHLHSILPAETNTAAAGPNHKTPLSESMLESFHGALGDAVSSTLEKFGIHPSEVKISITPATAASNAPVSTTSNTPVRTTPPPPTTINSASASNAGSSSAGSSSSATSAPNGGYDPFLQAAYDNPYKTAPAPSTSSSPTKSTAATNPQQAFDDAYWAKQPAAVQALRNIQDPATRTLTATQLANQGYSIDVPIMVWGWDPSIVTSMRQADGYTWVPSALQNPIELAPGLSMGGVPAYDPNNPPPGSITV
jgi:hypothetical protein